MYLRSPRNIRSSRTHGIVEQDLRARACGKVLFNIFCDDKFEQSEKDRRVFRKFDDGEVEIVVFMHVDDILAHA